MFECSTTPLILNYELRTTRMGITPTTNCKYGGIILVAIDHNIIFFYSIISFGMNNVLIVLLGARVQRRLICWALFLYVLFYSCIIIVVYDSKRMEKEKLSFLLLLALQYHLVPGTILYYSHS